MPLSADVGSSSSLSQAIQVHGMAGQAAPRFSESSLVWWYLA